jgi:hypothetical protein
MELKRQTAAMFCCLGVREVRFFDAMIFMCGIADQADMDWRVHAITGLVFDRRSRKIFALPLFVWPVTFRE